MNRKLTVRVLIIALSLVFLFATTNVKAQSIPTPASQLGFEPGDDRKLADWEQITKYFTILDKASDRVMVREVGKSTQGRPFLLATISSSKNLKNLKKYQEIQSKLADPRKIKSPSELEELIKKAKTSLLFPARFTPTKSSPRKCLCSLRTR